MNKKTRKFKVNVSNADFRDRIASICLGIPLEQVVLNRNSRIEAAREKWVAKHFGTSHVRRGGGK